MTTHDPLLLLLGACARLLLAKPLTLTSQAPSPRCNRWRRPAAVSVVLLEARGPLRPCPFHHLGVPVQIRPPRRHRHGQPEERTEIDQRGGPRVTASAPPVQAEKVHGEQPHGYPLGSARHGRTLISRRPNAIQASIKDAQP